MLNDRNSDAIKHAIKNNGNINGEINNLFLSMVRSDAKNELNVKFNGDAHIAQDVRKIIGVYETSEGKVYSKSDFVLTSNKVELNNNHIDLLKTNLVNSELQKISNANISLTDNKVKSSSLEKNIKLFLSSNKVSLTDVEFYDVLKKLNDPNKGFVEVEGVYILNTTNYANSNLFIKTHRDNKILVLGNIENYKNDIDVVLTDKINIIKDNSTIFDSQNSLELQKQKMFHKYEELGLVVYSENC
jgi:hypothetical protein